MKKIKIIKKISFFAAVIVALNPGGGIAAEYEKPTPSCAELVVAVKEARERAMEKDYTFKKETIHKNPNSISKDISCMDKFSAYINIGDYDPSSITDFLMDFAKKMAEQACNAAEGALNSQLSKIASTVEGVNPSLPYGLGQIFDFDVKLSTSEMGVTAAPDLNVGSTTGSVFTKVKDMKLPF